MISAKLGASGCGEVPELMAWQLAQWSWAKAWPRSADALVMLLLGDAGDSLGGEKGDVDCPVVQPPSNISDDASSIAGKRLVVRMMSPFACIGQLCAFISIAKIAVSVF